MKDAVAEFPSPHGEKERFGGEGISYCSYPAKNYL